MRSIYLLLFMIIVVFEIILFGDIGSKIALLYERKSIYIAVYYTLVTFLGFFSVTTFFFVKNKIIFTFFVLVLFLSYGIDLVYKAINHTGFGFNDLGIALNGGAAFAMEALSSYASEIQSVVLILLGLLFILVIIRSIVIKKKLFISLKKISILFIITLLLSYSITHKTTAESQSRPTLFKVLNTSIYFLFNQLYYGEREALKVTPSKLSSYKNIILIVDESVGGQYLSINGYEKETTPYLQSISDAYVNLGLASSAANCSDKSNIALMSGIQMNQLPDKSQQALKMPSIFQYAKNAGYRTHYFSAQKVGMDLQNYITNYDLLDIDNFSQLDKPYTHKSMPEQSIILATQKALEKNDKNFIFIVKRGVHFHWENDYPVSEKYFVPTLEQNEPLLLEKKKEALNSYANSLKYNVDLFFKYFLEKIDFFTRKDTLIIYTSDHGQSILEEGRVATHCDSTTPPKTQGIVPLLLFSNNSVIRNFDFKTNRYSHYEIFPTIQKLMGYETLRGKTLFDEVFTKQEFISGDIFGRGHVEFTTIK